MPLELCDILEYSKSLNYFEKPDYDFLRKCLYSAFENSINDPEFMPITVVFDWHTREEVDYHLYR